MVGTGSEGLARFGEVKYNASSLATRQEEITIGAGSKKLCLNRFDGVKYNALRPQNEPGPNYARRGLKRVKSNSFRGGKI